MCFTLGVFTNSVTQVLIEWLYSSLVDALVYCVVCHRHKWQLVWHHTAHTEQLRMKAMWLIGYGDISTTQRFPVCKNTLSRLGGGGGGKRPFYTLSQKFLLLFFFFFLNITAQMFLWIPYSQCLTIDNEGTCRNGGGGLDNPLGIQLCSKGVLGRVTPGDAQLTNALHS